MRGTQYSLSPTSLTAPVINATTINATRINGLQTATASAVGGVTLGPAATGAALANVASTGSAADLSGLAASATVDTTNAANISSGTLSAARLPAGTTTQAGAVKLGTDAEAAIAEVAFATLPTTNLYPGRKVTMTDGIAGSGCAIGGGIIPKLCRWDGASWKVLGVNPLEKNVANGIAGLDAGGLMLPAQLPPAGATTPGAVTTSQFDASGAATTVQGRLTTEVTRAQAAESANSTAVATNTTAITTEATTARAAEGTKELAIAEVTFATLPVTNLYAGRKVTMTDGVTGSGCTVGGGAVPKFCRYDGANWKALSVNPLEKNVANGVVGLGPIVPTLGTSATFDAAGRPFQVGNYAQLFAAGDSYVMALSLPKRQGFMGLLAGDVPSTKNGFAEIATSGTTTPTISGSMYVGFSTNPLQPSFMVLDGSTNDGNQDTSTPTGGTSPSIMNFYNTMMFDTLWGSIQYTNSTNAVQKKMASTCTVTSGTWTPYLSGTLGVPAIPVNGNGTQGNEDATATVNGTLTCTLTTPTTANNLFFMYRQVNGATGTFNVTVDGTAQLERCGGTTTWAKGGCSGQYGFSNPFSQSRVAQLIPVTAGATTHTVVITNLDATNLYLTAVGFLTPAPDPNSNVVAYLNTNTSTTWSYSSIYNAAIVTVMTALHSAGQSQIFQVDQNNTLTYAGVTYPALSSTDLGITATCPVAVVSHPNCAGSLKLRDLFLYTAALNGYPVGFYGGGDANMPERFYAALESSVASATTIAPTSGTFHVSGTVAVATITLPTYCIGSGSASRCVLTMIPDALFTTVATGNIALASTPVVGRPLVMTYDPGGAKWYPSY